MAPGSTTAGMAAKRGSWTTSHLAARALSLTEPQMPWPSAQSSEEMYARAIEHAETAEALGFRNMWLAEHHFSTYGYVGRPVQLATYLAAKTSKIRVGTAVIVVPLHHPLMIAEEIA